jgi:hypothetical protein
VSATAVTRAKARFPESRVDYRVADLLDAPVQWRQAFDLVVEALTVQSLPPDLREQAVGAVTGFVAAGGELLVVSAQQESGEFPEGPPWPLTRAEIESFARDGLELRSLADTDQRWCAWFAFSG